MKYIAEHASESTMHPPAKPTRQTLDHGPKMLRNAIIGGLLIALMASFAVARLYQQSSGSAPSNLVLDQVSMISPNEGWAIGNPWNATWDLNLPKTWKNSTIYHYVNGRWNVETLNAPDVVAVHLYQFQMLSRTDGWALGDAIVRDAPATTRQIVMRYDGTKWSPIDDSGQATPDRINGFIGEAAFQVISDSSLWVGSSFLSPDDSERNLPAIGHLTDGHTWTIETLPLPYTGKNVNLHITSISMVNDDEGWLTARISLPTSSTSPSDAKNESVLYHRIQGQWVVEKTIESITDYFSQVMMTSTSDGWATGIQVVQPIGTQLPVATNYPNALLYHYAQGVWTPFSTTVAIPTTSVPLLGMISSQDGWMFINAAQPQILHFAGTQWQYVQQIGTNINDRITINAVSFSSPEEGWAVGSRTSTNSSIYYPYLLHYSHGVWSAYN